MVSKASDDFPDPESPVITTNLSRGISTLIFFKLCTLAPLTIILLGIKLHKNSDYYTPLVKSRQGAVRYKNKANLKNMRLFQNLKHIPHSPGVYFFKNARGNFLYIGKAKDLRKRVSQYQRGRLNSPQTAIMLAKTAKIDFLV